MRAKSRLAEMAASSFPSCQARPKSSSWIESKRPPLPLALRLPASRRRSATAARLLLGTGLICLLSEVFACLGNAQQDAQLPRAVFPRVPASAVEHTRYNSSRKRRQLKQPASPLRAGKDPEKVLTGQRSRAERGGISPLSPSTL